MNDWENPEFWRMLEWARQVQKQHQRQFGEVLRVSRQMNELMKAARSIAQTTSHLQWNQPLSVQQAIEAVHRLRQSPLAEATAQQGRQLEQIRRLSAQSFPDLTVISRTP